MPIFSASLITIKQGNKYPTSSIINLFFKTSCQGENKLG